MMKVTCVARTLKQVRKKETMMQGELPDFGRNTSKDERCEVSSSDIAGNCNR